MAGPWEEWLEHIGSIFPVLGERRTQTAGSLSGGEQQMLALCRALVGRAAGRARRRAVDGPGAARRRAALRAGGRPARRRASTIVLVEQYLTHALRYADLCYVLAKGRVAWCGEPSELRGSGAAGAFLGTG